MLRVAVVGGVVKYSKNGVVFYTSTKVPVYPLLVDTALYSVGATLNNALISSGGRRRPRRRDAGGGVDVAGGSDGEPGTR